MSSSLQIPRRLSGVVLVLAALTFGTEARGQAAAKTSPPPATRAVVALGESLFKDVRLSSTGSMSCASCHRPERSFTEDKERAVGQSGAVLGRNTPTLLGIASVESFPVGGSLMASPKMVPLEERVLLPLHELAEMDASVDGAVGRLSADPLSVETFSAAFRGTEGHGDAPAVSSDRIAAALAGYVRSLRPNQGPGQLALAGSNIQLEEPVVRGLEVFRETGRCQSCHSGPGLTDGKLHIVALLRPPDASKLLPFPRPSSRPAASLALVDAAASDTRPVQFARNVRIGRGGYDGPLFERQTLPLVDVSRTAPYFRDGSVATLSEAVTQHVADLRKVGDQRAAILEDPLVLFQSQGLRVSKVVGHSSFRLNPTTKEQLSSDAWIPPELTKQQLDDLVSFLTSLSTAD